MSEPVHLTPPQLSSKPGFLVEGGRWKNIAARLYATGTSVEQLGEELGMDVEKVSGWLMSPSGKKMVMQFAGEGKKAADRMLEGQRISNLMALIKLRDGAKSDSARLGAATTLQKMLDAHDGFDDLKTPEEKKAALENAMKQIAKLNIR